MEIPAADAGRDIREHYERVLESLEISLQSLSEDREGTQGSTPVESCPPAREAHQIQGVRQWLDNAISTLICWAVDIGLEDGALDVFSESLIGNTVHETLDTVAQTADLAMTGLGTRTEFSLYSPQMANALEKLQCLIEPVQMAQAVLLQKSSDTDLRNEIVAVFDQATSLLGDNRRFSGGAAAQQPSEAFLDDRGSTQEVRSPASQPVSGELPPQESASRVGIGENKTLEGDITMISARSQQDVALPTSVSHIGGLYKYRPLDGPRAIRIFTLYPGHDDIPRGTLTIKQDDEDYEALSWYWGSEDESAIIQIKDQESWCNFYVKPTLMTALQQLRRETTSVRKFWIDAICIDQSSSAEKNTQVPMMDKIYGNATNVCVWLGQDMNESETAIKFIKNRLLDLGNFDDLVNDQKTSSDWAALIALISRPWFSRRWVIQEIALAKSATLYCGTHKMPWTEFATAVALFERQSKRLLKLTKGDKKLGYNPDYLRDAYAMGASRLIETTSSMFRKSEDGAILERLLTLEALVAILSDFDCRVPHDVFYAVLALGKDTHRHHRVRRYSAKIETVDSINTTKPFTDQEDQFADRTRVDGGAVSSEQKVADTSTQNVPNTVGLNKHPAVATATKDEEEYTEKDRAQIRGVIRALQDKAKHPKIFKVDYEMPFFEVCKHFLEFAISTSKSLDLLCRPWAPEGLNLPSWIPDLSGTAFRCKMDRTAPGRQKLARRNADPLVGLATSQRKNYSAARTTTADLIQSWYLGDGSKTDSRSMFVFGFVLDTVAIVEDRALMGIIPGSWLDIGWPDRNLPTPERFWRTLVADRAPDGRNCPLYYSRAWEHAVSQSDTYSGIDTRELIQNDGDEIMAEFCRRVQAVIWDKRLILTRANGEQHLLGLGSKKVKVGDKLCILHGCSVPVFLRLTAQGTYGFLGEAYLHGMMDGEAMDFQESQGIPGQWFELR